MADMHVLDIVNGVARVVMHFPVPTGNNAVGTPWATALLESAGFNEDRTPATPKTVLRTITAGEKNNIQAGAVAEFVTDIAGLTEGTVASRQALIRTVYTAFKAAKTTEFQNRFNLYGHTETEA